MKKLRELAEKIDFNEGSSHGVQDAFLRHLIHAHEAPPPSTKPRRRRRRSAPLAEMDAPQQLSFDFGDRPAKKN